MNSRSRPPRVRVTAPVTPRATRRTPRGAQHEIDEQTAVGLIFVRSLVRSQLRLSLGILGALLTVVAGIPLLLWLFPEVTNRQVLGMPLGWVLLAFGVYPVLLGLGWIYLRRAERIEDAFADVVER